MTAFRKRRSGASRRATLTLRIASGIAIIWLVFVVFLDVQHALFPKTTIGGLEILAAALILFVLVRFIGTLAARLCRSLSGNRHKQRGFSGSAL